MSETEAVLFANDRFYAAFAAGDIAAMEDIWAAENVLCVHPGWAPMFGRDEVIESWRSILGDENAPAIVCRAPRATVYGDTAIVVCIEDLDGSLLCATNVFVRSGGEWRMTHHHAGPVHMKLEDLPDPPESAIN